MDSMVSLRFHTKGTVAMLPLRNAGLAQNPLMMSFHFNRWLRTGFPLHGRFYSHEMQGRLIIPKIIINET